VGSFRIAAKKKGSSGLTINILQTNCHAWLLISIRIEKYIGRLRTCYKRETVFFSFSR